MSENMHILELGLDGDHLFLGGKGAIKVQTPKKDPQAMKPSPLFGRLEFMQTSK